MKILISTGSFGDFDSAPLNLLKKNKINVVINPFGRKLSKEESANLYKDIDGVIAGTEDIDAQVLNTTNKLKVISRCGAGIDNIDMKCAKDKQIKVFNTASAPVIAVAELTVGLILALLRSIALTDRQIRGGIWKKNMGNLLNGKIVGIIGFGRIGKQTAMLLSKLGAKIIYYDPIINNKSSYFSKVELNKLLSQADIISLHMSYSNNNHHFIAKREIALMKKSAFIVNVSRGGVIDEEVLYSALKNKDLAGAALDVFESEPYSGKLKELDNTILTSHIGSYAKEARIQMEMEAVKNLLKGLNIK